MAFINSDAAFDVREWLMHKRAQLVHAPCAVSVLWPMTGLCLDLRRPCGEDQSTLGFKAKERIGGGV